MRGLSTSSTTRRGALAAAALAGALVTSSAFAQHAHTHEPVEIDPTLDWPTLIETTLAAHPSSVELTARGEEAAAWQKRGRQWLAAAPALYFSYLSDRRLDDQGQVQYDGGVELPLWRLGQRSAVQALASSATAASSAAAAALELEVTGLLRGALWDIAAADLEVNAAREAVAVAADLVRIVERRQATGDLPQADLLLARTALLERQQAEIDAEAMLVDAERGYRTLTGLDHRPAEFAEERSEIEDFTLAHPFVALADADLERARANESLVAREARGPLTLTVGPHREYDPFGTLPRDSVTVGVHVPVGGKAHGATQTASAARQRAAAEAARGNLLRRLDADLHEAEHTLATLEESLELATQRTEVADQQLRMAQSAFTQGEIELRELLRVQDTTLTARRDVQRLGIEQQRTVAALNQALGDTP